MIVSNGIAIGSMLMQPMRSLISWLMHTLPFTVTDNMFSSNRPMFFHELPNGNIIRSDNLPRELAIKRMIDEERWCKEHREELEVSSQQLFDDMFGG